MCLDDNHNTTFRWSDYTLQFELQELELLLSLIVICGEGNPVLAVFYLYFLLQTFFPVYPTIDACDHVFAMWVFLQIHSLTIQQCERQILTFDGRRAGAMVVLPNISVFKLTIFPN